MYWEGNIISVQPRITLLRSFDQRSHVYLGYVLGIEGVVNEEKREYTIAVGKGAHYKHQFQIGQKLSGECEKVNDPKKETTEFYKASKIKVHHQPELKDHRSPPWQGIPPELPIYRQRGHRRLAAITYDSSCKTVSGTARCQLR